MDECHVILALIVVLNIWLLIRAGRILGYIEIMFNNQHEAPIWLSRDARKQAILDYDFLRNTKP